MNILNSTPLELLAMTIVIAYLVGLVIVFMPMGDDDK
jgi:hypothetical protein